jgi:hypothetical protein
MFATLIGLGRGREKHECAAEELMARLAEKASLVVDDSLVSELGVGRKALYRIIYDLVRRERMFMLADSDDRMLLMTNTEFNRFMFRRAGLELPPEPAQSVAEDSDIYIETDDSDIVLEEMWEIPAAALDSTLAGNLSHAIPEPLGTETGTEARPKTQRHAEETLVAARDNLDWFSLDVARGEADSGYLPDTRQSLPERKREPWLSFEDVGQA